MAKLVLNDGTTVDVKNYITTASIAGGIVFDAEPIEADLINTNMSAYDLTDAKITTDDGEADLVWLNGMKYTGTLYVDSVKSEVTAVLDVIYYEVTQEEKDYIEAAKILLGERN